MLKLLPALATWLTLAAPGPIHAQHRAVVDPHRITVTIVPGVRSSNELPTEPLMAARRALSDGAWVSVEQMRQLADLGDGFAALRLARWLDRQGDEVPAADVAHYYGVAAATGRGGAISNMIRILDTIPPEDLGPRRAEVLRNIILSYAQAGNSNAIEAAFRYHAKGLPFGSLEAELTDVVDKAVGDAAAELALKLAVIRLQEPAETIEELEHTQALLETAMTASSLQTLLTAQNLMPVLETAMLDFAPQPTEENQ